MQSACVCCVRRLGHDFWKFFLFSAKMIPSQVIIWPFAFVRTYLVSFESASQWAKLACSASVYFLTGWADLAVRSGGGERKYITISTARRLLLPVLLNLSSGRKSSTTYIQSNILFFVRKFSFLGVANSVKLPQLGKGGKRFFVCVCVCVCVSLTFVNQWLVGFRSNSSILCKRMDGKKITTKTETERERERERRLAWHGMEWENNYLYTHQWDGRPKERKKWKKNPIKLKNLTVITGAKEEGGNPILRSN